jgi:hypothetical protein
MARVDGQGEEPIECTPIVYDEAFNCGVGIIYSTGGASVWGLVAPRNLIAAWRGTEILQRLDYIGHGTLAAAYYTGLRDPHESDLDRYVKPTIAKIGQPAYDEIMAMSVPEEVIRAILDNQKESEGHFPPDTWPIAQEVRAGTITWRQEFADAGIEHPDETDAKKRAQDETTARFENYFVNLAKRDNLPRDCMGMWSVESALLQVVDKGLDVTYGNEVAMALAAIVGRLSNADFAYFLMPSFGPASKEDMYHRMEQIKREAVNSYANWIVSMTGSKPRWWRRKPATTKTREDYVHLLMKLVNQHFPPKDPEMAHQVTEEYERADPSS